MGLSVIKPFFLLFSFLVENSTNFFFFLSLALGPFQGNRSKPEARARQVREVANNSCTAEAQVHALRKRDVSHHYRPVERT